MLDANAIKEILEQDAVQFFMRTSSSVVEQVEKCGCIEYVQSKAVELYTSKNSSEWASWWVVLWFKNEWNYSIYEKPWTPGMKHLKKIILHEMNTMGFSDLIHLAHPSMQVHIMIEVLYRFKHDKNYEIFAPGVHCCKRVQQLIDYVCDGVLPADDIEWFQYYSLTGEDKESYDVSNRPDVSECEICI